MVDGAFGICRARVNRSWIARKNVRASTQAANPRQCALSKVEIIDDKYTSYTSVVVNEDLFSRFNYRSIQMLFGNYYSFTF